MKRVIAFVFLGLLIYAGIFVTFYGIHEIETETGVPQPLGNSIRSGLVVEDTLGSVTGKLGVEQVRSSFLGVEFGKVIERHYYVIPAGDTPNFMLIAVTDPDDAAAIEKVNFGGEFSFTGRTVEMDNKVFNKTKDYIIDNPHLVDGENKIYTLEIIAQNHIEPYIIEVRDIGDHDFTPLIVGAAMLIAGIGLAALLILKIVREKSGY